ncbi:Hypothetical predicted protein [Lecanosticta acicola]|uniref:Uncharacterized protein n=1 Tax=Lecanosticta acicola TaxID=111012 RepID=A0AAI9E780_9PEZI|nr:Hypothetical predicted protein [Lecanosticta acicola]
MAVWKHNARSLTYVHEFGHYFFKMLLHQDFEIMQLPRYLKEDTKEDLRDRAKCPYAFVPNTESKSYNEFVSATPERFETFNKRIAAMGAQMKMLGIFPFGSLKQQVGAGSDRAFIVDAGG